MRYSHVLGTVVSLAAATAAQAVMSNIRIVPVQSDGSTGARTYDLVVDTSAAGEWVSGELQFSLANAGALSGSFYNDARATVAGQKSPLDLATAASANKYDTWLTSPERFTATGSEVTPGSVEIIGKSQSPVESGTGSAIFPAAASGNSQVDVAWGSVYPAAAAGSYTIARLAVLGNTGANISGRIGYKNNSSAPITFSNIYLPIAGDLNGDRGVDLSDLDAWITNNGTTNVAGDANLDGAVDLADLDVWITNNGNGLAAAGPALGSVVPEPASLSVLAIAASALVARRRR